MIDFFSLTIDEQMRTLWDKSLTTDDQIAGLIADMRQELSIQSLQMDRMQKSITILQWDIIRMKAGIRDLWDSIEALRKEVAELKTDVAGLKSDVAQLKTDVAQLKTDVAEIKDLLKRKLA